MTSERVAKAKRWLQVAPTLAEGRRHIRELLDEITELNEVIDIYVGLHDDLRAALETYADQLSEGVYEELSTPLVDGAMDPNNPDGQEYRSRLRRASELLDQVQARLQVSSSIEAREVCVMIDKARKGMATCRDCGHDHLRHDGWYEPCPEPECASEYSVGGKCWITNHDG
ncbi:hypothetical protein SEA_PUPPER_225 [Gordonia phage Pupper]|uniref:Uncharacterized protein n=1 Tax=Gordonia phage Pupper TaxID=2571249 RepID=A0A4Y6EMS2_9CAUD|nr:hypothetical protein KHQ83_gp052 [Gordonia phage Pupper]QDF18711.1 hypothetical protein SEA_PUPPER_225 [Gordonia phage Pupper]